MKPLLILLFILGSQRDYAQNVGLGTTTPNANAVLEIKSPNKGILIPRMDSVVRKQITNTKGLLIYDTTTNSLWHNDGAKWVNYLNMPKGNVTQDMLQWNGSNWVIMPKGLPGQLLVANASGLPQWQYPATLAINDVSVTEGNTGTVNMTFTVTKTAIYDRAISVQYATTDGTTTAGTDYTAVSGTLNFLPAEMSKTITVVVNGDLVDAEPDETFSVNLFSAVSATITDAKGTGTITNDDVFPGIFLDTYGSGYESRDYPGGYVVIPIYLEAPCNQPVTVYFECKPGTATINSDFYTGDNSVTFQPGETEAEIIVAITDDDVYEWDETFTVDLTSADGGYIVNGQATCTIIDNDPQPSITIENAYGAESSFLDNIMIFKVHISGYSQLPVTVHYSLSDGTAIMAESDGNDFYSASDILTFPPMFEGYLEIVVYIINDYELEPDEYFFINLDSPVNATIETGNGKGTIYDDDE